MNNEFLRPRENSWKWFNELGDKEEEGLYSNGREVENFEQNELSESIHLMLELIQTI